ncbi:MAG TPA: hypothetical protein PK957_00020 [Candidatus Dojkabacteria bacterium]|nr:hypothetical protein [Candidatus Dojkabacteria bacterium]HQF36959.1 hypothetical protein [Candidatus Dojkabacteria bacterium]
MKFKKNISAFFILLLLWAIPIVVLELRKDVIEKNSAGSEVINNLPQISTFPSTKAQRGQQYITSISANDKDEDTLKYSFICDEVVNGCIKDEIKFPEGMMIDRNTGEIRWNVPADASDTVDVVVYVSDGTDVIYYDYSLWIEDGDYYVREFSTLPSSGKIDPGSEMRFRLVIEKYVQIKSIKAIFILDGVEVDSLEWGSFDDDPIILIDYNSTPAFVYTPEINGIFSVELEIETMDGDVSLVEKVIGMIFPKVMASSSLSFTASENSLPVFDPTTDPYLNNSVKVGEMYSFDLKATDAEDVLFYSIVTPDPEHDWKDWLTVVPVVSDEGKKITFQLRGIPSKVGAYMIAISVNDGIKNHYVTKIWPIVVKDDTNDIPRINITSPTAPVKVYPNGHVKFKWSVTDNNQIVKQIFYYSTNPADKSTWRKIREFDQSVNEYSWQNGLTPGTYFVIIEAYDNMTPAGVGFSITNQIVVLPAPPEPDDDDPNENNGGGEIISAEPFFSSITPRDGAIIEKLPITISTSIGVIKGAKIQASSVSILLDGEDIKDKCKINQNTESELSISCVIDELEEGQHEVVIDAGEKENVKTTKTWYFKYLPNGEITGEEKKDDSTEDQNVFQKVVSYWKNMATNLRLLVCIGGVLILLGLLLLIPLIFSTRRKESYTYTYNESKSDKTYAPPSNDNSSDLSQSSAYDSSTFYSTDSSFGGPVVTVGKTTDSSVPVDNWEPYSATPVDSSFDEKKTLITSDNTTTVNSNSVASDTLAQLPTNPSSLVSPEEEQPNKSANLTTPPPVDTVNDPGSDGFVPPPTLSV